MREKKSKACWQKSLFLINHFDSKRKQKKQAANSGPRQKNPDKKTGILGWDCTLEFEGPEGAVSFAGRRQGKNSCVAEAVP